AAPQAPPPLLQLDLVWPQPARLRLARWRRRQSVPQGSKPEPCSSKCALNGDRSFGRSPKNSRGPRVTREAPRSNQAAPSGCEPDVDSPTEATAEDSHCGRIWSSLARCRLRATCKPVFFLRKCHRITTQALSYPRVPHRVRANRVCGKAWSVRCATAARPRTSDRGNG